MKNYYEILEVNKKASKEVIEKAYKVLVKKYHPDLNKNGKGISNEQKIKEINEAYDVLSNDFLREQYDLEIEKQMAKKNVIPRTKETSSNTQNRQTKEKAEVEQINENMKKHKVGSFSGIIALLKELYKSKPKREEFKEVTKKDIIALILTIIVVIILGVVLWQIPFTKGWMQELLFENPLFNWIAGLFSK